jgi:hypothetical protein
VARRRRTRIAPPRPPRRSRRVQRLVNVQTLLIARWSVEGGRLPQPHCRPVDRVQGATTELNAGCYSEVVTAFTVDDVRPPNRDGWRPHPPDPGDSRCVVFAEHPCADATPEWSTWACRNSAHTILPCDVVTAPQSSEISPMIINPLRPCHSVCAVAEASGPRRRLRRAVARVLLESRPHRAPAGGVLNDVGYQLTHGENHPVAKHVLIYASRKDCSDGCACLPRSGTFHGRTSNTHLRDLVHRTLKPTCLRRPSLSERPHTKVPAKSHSANADVWIWTKHKRSPSWKKVRAPLCWGPAADVVIAAPAFAAATDRSPRPPTGHVFPLRTARTHRARR